MAQSCDTSTNPGGEACPCGILVKASKLIGKDVKNLGRALEIPDPKIEAIHLDEEKYGAEAVAYKILVTWRRMQGDNATEEKLASVFVEMKRMESLEKCNKDKPLPLEGLKSNLKQQYKRLRLKGLPWMHDVCLSLDNHYIELAMRDEKPEGASVNAEKLTLELTDLFRKSHPGLDERLDRILIEGDAGFGKTTIGIKLCYDYYKQQNYLKHFDLVLFYALRNFQGKLEEVLVTATGTTVTQGKQLTKIINTKSVMTLLILNGYDELPHQQAGIILDIILKKIFPHVTVVVASRPGNFTPKALSSNPCLSFASPSAP